MRDNPILAYDCATTGATVALKIADHTYRRQIDQTRQAADLVAAIDALLHEHQVAYTDLGAIISTVGPGSFTGVRIGLAALHGFALVSRTPIKLLSTLEAMAWQVVIQDNPPPHYMVALRAGKGEVYAQAFESMGDRPSSRGDIFLAPEDKTDWNMPCFSSMADLASPYFISAPDAAVMCHIATSLPTASLAEAVPIYIRPPDAIAPTPHTWLRTN